MIFTRGTECYRIVIGLNGGCYVTVWRDEIDRRSPTPHWLVSA